MTEDMLWYQSARISYIDISTVSRPECTRGTYRFIPIDRPAIVTGVNITCETLFIAMELVRATEVHLAGQCCVIALAPEVVGICRGVGGQVRCIIVRSNLGRQLSADHHKA